jgi:inhibitor of cysteine peptidase
VTIASVARRAALALAALPLLSCESPTLAQEQPDRLTVESVEIRILESFPVQVSASVTGYLRDGCERLGATTQSRSGNTITVTIATGREQGRGQSCIQVISPVQQEVRLEGAFTAGSYVVRVNGLERTFRVD